MTRGESELISDLNDFVRQTSDQLDEQETSTGIRPHPRIESTEQTLDTSRFGLEFAPQPETTVQSEESTGTLTPITGACCFDDGTCLVETETACGNGGGTYQGNNSVCDPNPCGVCNCHCDGITVQIRAIGLVTNNDGTVLSVDQTRSHTFTRSDFNENDCFVSTSFSEVCVDGCTQPDPPDQVYGEWFWSFGAACYRGTLMQGSAFAEFGCCVPTTDPCDSINGCQANYFVNCGSGDQVPGVYNIHCDEECSDPGCVATMDIEVTITCNG